MSLQWNILQCCCLSIGIHWKVVCSVTLQSCSSLAITWRGESFAYSCWLASGRCRRWAGHPSCSRGRSRRAAWNPAPGCQWSCGSRCCQTTSWRCGWRGALQGYPGKQNIHQFSLIHNLLHCDNISINLPHKINLSESYSLKNKNK